jgi:hypothetical protein
LRQRYLGLLADLAALYESRHESHPAIEVLGRQLAADAAHEGAHRALMRLYVPGVQRQQALRQYQALCDTLERQRSAEPDTESWRLHQEILDGRFPAARSTPAAHATPDTAGHRDPGDAIDPAIHTCLNRRRDRRDALFHLGIDGPFIVTYAAVVRRSFPLVQFVSLAVWLCLSLAAVLIHFDSFALAVAGFLVLLSLSYAVTERVLRVKSLAGRATPLSTSIVALRAGLSGTISTLAVATLGVPLVSGVFAAFPAVFLSTMILTYVARGWAFSVGVMKTLMLSGTINTAIYATAARLLYPACGLIIGTLGAVLLSLAASIVSCCPPERLPEPNLWACPVSGTPFDEHQIAQLSSPQASASFASPPPTSVSGCDAAQAAANA